MATAGTPRQLHWLSCRMTILIALLAVLLPNAAAEVHSGTQRSKFDVTSKSVAAKERGSTATATGRSLNEAESTAEGAEGAAAGAKEGAEGEEAGGESKGEEGEENPEAKEEKGKEGEESEEGKEGEEGKEPEEGEEGGEGEEKKEGEEGEEGEEGGEGEGEEGEEEECKGEKKILEEGECFSLKSVEVGCMLLGSVSFVLALLYLVNWDDDDIRRYTWKIISTTISIFLAVLLFGGFNQIVILFFAKTEKELEEMSEEKKMMLSIVQVGHCVMYICMLQLVIAVISGTVCESGPHKLDEESWVINDPLTKDHGAIVKDESKVRNPTGQKSVIKDEYGMEVPVQKTKVEFNQRERRMKCYARLLAHMAGFAAMNAGATMQQLEIFHPQDAKWRSVLPVIIIEVVVLGVFGIFSLIRAMAKAQAKAEGRAGKRAKMMSEEVFEAENDISSLSISFLLIQVARFCLSGILPNAEGLEKDEEHKLHDDPQIIWLFSIGLACALVASVLVVAKAKLTARNKDHHQASAEEEEEETLAQRLTIVGLNASSMCFAWALLFGTRWLCFRTHSVGLPSIMGRVDMALILSLFAGLCVFGLDFIDDNFQGGDRQSSKAGTEAIQMLVNSLGILIGFSWEHVFDGSVAAVAANTERPEIVKFVMGVSIAVMMTPMWRRHILTKEINLQKRRDEEEEMKGQAEQEDSRKSGNSSASYSPLENRSK
mmetsp:Transcript_130370/g.260054  ORF Transcript_130370/g.260054 Transcript_130370/m.260054 type:complete len:714 (+) Transcript_130370:62-2203(+)|eukprot:CAMPEP_0172808212 /NCGR_PEP_ID=MMETSP1075-20121228/7530_1 /TAXON_ID=2916 /ORGANISM="Ceratium fusus, Strain PA161109" /LENGTH=713 /DNA_ID=CAMNT_0013647325 /DNA_START=57 /DNA_END=2198 /DNA_ORIENTATION=-